MSNHAAGLSGHTALGAAGVMVVMKYERTCMTMRGVRMTEAMEFLRRNAV